jgi:hypothetical protein
LPLSSFFDTDRSELIPIFKTVIECPFQHL